MGRFQITDGKIEKAKKVVIYGVEGIGKSTFASKFPVPLFIDTEGSTAELKVKRYPKPTSWQMLKDEVIEIINERPCKTLVIDTADWAERLCTESICDQYGKKGVEDFGYGNGYTYVAEEWGRFLNLLQDVVDVANINVVLTAHAIIRKFEQPNEMGAYDRYELKLGKKTTAQTAPITKEWADMVLFANYKTYSVAVDEKGKKHKAQGGQRVMYTTHHPCWDAKNRYGLADELSFDYEHIRNIIENNTSSIGQVSYTDNVGQTLDIAQGIESGPQIYHIDDKPEPISDVSTESVSYEGIPKALVDLMKLNNITEKQIQKVVASKGYYPEDMPIKDYDQGFIQGVLIGAWEQVLNEITLPF